MRELSDAVVRKKQHDTKSCLLLITTVLSVGKDSMNGTFTVRKRYE